MGRHPGPIGFLIKYIELNRAALLSSALVDA